MSTGAGFMECTQLGPPKLSNALCVSYKDLHGSGRTRREVCYANCNHCTIAFGTTLVSNRTGKQTNGQGTHQSSRSGSKGSTG
jgi:hypothetical protein